MTREEAIEWFKNSAFYHKDHEPFNMAISALEQESNKSEIPTSCDDAISREAVLKGIEELKKSPWATDKRGNGFEYLIIEALDVVKDLCVKQVPSVTQKSGKWIPVSERLPENTYPVNITWVNHDPEPYYATIKDKPFTATGCYCDGKWYWYSVTCQDYLDEYRYCDVDSMDEEIEVTAWMPLPKPYDAERESEE